MPTRAQRLHDRGELEGARLVDDQAHADRGVLHRIANLPFQPRFALATAATGLGAGATPALADTIVTATAFDPDPIVSLVGEHETFSADRIERTLEEAIADFLAFCDDAAGPYESQVRIYVYSAQSGALVDRAFSIGLDD